MRRIIKQNSWLIWQILKLQNLAYQGNYVMIFSWFHTFFHCQILQILLARLVWYLLNRCYSFFCQNKLPGYSTSYCWSFSYVRKTTWNIVKWSQYITKYDICLTLQEYLLYTYITNAALCLCKVQRNIMSILWWY